MANMLPKFLRSQSITIDGDYKLGTLQNFIQPKIEFKTEDHEGGGMDTIEQVMGLEKLVASVEMSDIDLTVMRIVGFEDGGGFLFDVSQAYKREGEYTEVEHNFRGIVKMVDPGDGQAKQKSSFKFDVAIREYTYKVNGEIIHDIAPKLMKRKINGKDQLEEERRIIKFN